MNIGKNIRKNRKLAGLSQEDLAKRTGLSISSIQGYEHGKFVPKFENLKIIAAALNVHVGDLAMDYLPWEVQEDIINKFTKTPITSTVRNVVELLNELNEDGQAEIVKRARELIRLSEYKKER